MRDDLKSFIQSKSAAFSGQFRTNPDATSDGASVRLSNRLSKVTPGQLKPLYDSSYIPPDQNPAVIQDSDPIKQLTMAQALRRYEGEVDRRKQMNEELIAKHFSKIRQDEDQAHAEHQLKKKKQELFQQELAV